MYYESMKQRNGLITNTEEIKNAIKHFKNNEAGLSIASGLKPSMIERVKAGYVPSKVTRKLFSILLNKPESILFPPIENAA